MKKLYLIVAVFFSLKSAHAQRLVFDRGHLDIINSNGAVRLAGQLAYSASWEQIKKNTDDINLNLTSVVIVQNMIYRSLTEINEALKDAIQVKRLGYLITDIYNNSHDVLELAKGNPVLMLFAEDSAKQLKLRGIKMVGDVSSFILKNQENVLMNYNVRDELINNTVKELQIMNAMIYTIKQNMYWAKQRGLIKAFNPWAQFMTDDENRLNEIIIRRKFLGQ